MARPIGTVGADVEAKNLSKTYDERTKVLNRISFRVEKQEVFVIIGPSGVGKTTLLRLIDLLEYPTSGKLLLKGVDTTGLNKIGRLQLRRRIGMVFQSTLLFDANVYSNISYGLRIRGVPKKKAERKVTKALSTVGLENFERRHAKTLSGGEAQRVAIARVLAYEPELILLDEPTANLDPANTSTIEKAILRAKQNYGATIIVATHNMFQARRLGGRVALFLNGRFVEVNDPETMFTNPREPETKAFITGKLVY
ncbi:MAG: phosphate ABC transporter ATP-binding protein [Candidatus Atabeyarchaeum deiterrae]